MKKHLPEYLAECVGTAIMMILGVGAIALMWSEVSPMPWLIPNPDLRRLMTGIMFAGGATLVVISPIGQRSGGHINPAVTLAFWMKGSIAGRDAIAYVIAQFIGALLGVGIIALIAADAVTGNIQFGLTFPGEWHGVKFGVASAFIAEVISTGLLVGLIFFCVGNQRFARYTPFLAGALVATLVFVEAPISGTSVNPARSLAPALFGSFYADQWLYMVAPPIGAMLAVWLYALWSGAKAPKGCGKLFHTERYPCIFPECGYSRFVAGTVVLEEGEAGDRAYVIERGEVEVRKRGEDGKERTLATLGAGQWVGEMALLLKLPRTATVVATKDSQLRIVTPDNFAHVISEHPNEAVSLLGQLAGRLHESNRNLVL